MPIHPQVREGTPSRFRIRRIAPLVFMAVIAASSFFYRHNGSPEEAERLQVFPKQIYNYTVRRGQIYLGTLTKSTKQPPSAAGTDVFILHFQSVTGGARKEILRQNTQDESILDIRYEDQTVCYITESSSPAAPVDPSTNIRRYFLPGALASRRAAWKSTSPRNAHRLSQPAVLHRIPLEGGPEIKIPLDSGGFEIRPLPHVLTKEGLYWMRPVPTTRYFAVRHVPFRTSEIGRDANKIKTRHFDKTVEEIYEGDDLMFTPITGGPARKLASGLALDSLHIAGDGNLYGIGLCPIAGYNPSLFILPRNGSGAPINLHNFPSPDESIEDGSLSNAPTSLSIGTLENVLPLEFEGRLYWLERQKPAVDDTAAASNEKAYLFSCRPDGSDRRLQWDARDGSGYLVYPKRLFLNRGKMYLIYRQPSSGSSECVARLFPQRPSPLGSAHHFPNHVETPRDDHSTTTTYVPLNTRYVDGDYLYFTSTEERHSPLDFFYSRITTHYEMALYRIPLPD